MTRSLYKVPRLRISCVTLTSGLFSFYGYLFFSRVDWAAPSGYKTRLKSQTLIQIEFRNNVSDDATSDYRIYV